MNILKVLSNYLNRLSLYLDNNLNSESTQLVIAKFKFKEGTKIMIDRSWTDFSNCEYRILELNKDECKIQLTKKGLNTLYNNDYVEPFIHEFVSDELNGVLYFGASEDLEPETFNQVVKAYEIEKECGIHNWINDVK